MRSACLRASSVCFVAMSASRVWTQLTAPFSLSRAALISPLAAAPPSGQGYSGAGLVEDQRSRWMQGSWLPGSPCAMRDMVVGVGLVSFPSRSHTTSVVHPPPYRYPTRRHYSTRRGRLSSIEDAKKFLAALPVPQRMCLEKAVMETKKEEVEVVTPPTSNQLKLLCYQYSLPFIGFGFLDNFIMITVGEYIDFTVGAALSISTMAAAGIGNLISDLAGLGLADRVEALCKWLGIPDPKLSQAQLQHRTARWVGLLGRCLGIIIGCTIGMAPLLFFNDPHKPLPESDEQTKLLVPDEKEVVKQSRESK